MTTKLKKAVRVMRSCHNNEQREVALRYLSLLRRYFYDRGAGLEGSMTDFLIHDLEILMLKEM